MYDVILISTFCVMRSLYHHMHTDRVRPTSLDSLSHHSPACQGERKRVFLDAVFVSAVPQWQLQMNIVARFFAFAHGCVGV